MMTLTTDSASREQYQTINCFDFAERKDQYYIFVFRVEENIALYYKLKGKEIAQETLSEISDDFANLVFHFIDDHKNLETYAQKLSLVMFPLIFKRDSLSYYARFEPDMLLSIIDSL